LAGHGGLRVLSDGHRPATLEEGEIGCRTEQRATLRDPVRVHVILSAHSFPYTFDKVLPPP
ncbi:MAG: hypothetical protein ACYS30_19600, partial [Planctomycetota bacterium]